MSGRQQSYDIVIVGGGPAGLSAAYAAAKATATKSLQSKIILFEKDESIAHNVRTSGVTWIDEIQKLGIKSEYYNPIKNYSFISPSNEVTIRGARSTSCVLNVRSTYQHLAFLAAEAGAQIMVRSNVYKVNSDASGRIKGLKASTPKGDMTISCKLIIDATGFSSFIARRAGLANEWKRYGVGAEYECYCENLDLETFFLMVGRKYSEAGYAWIFPVAKNRVRIGVGVGRPESNEDPIQKLNSIIENKLSPIDRMGKIQPVELHYGFIPNEGVRKATVFDGLLMVGDSAGQANPLVLEGIRYAIEFGRLAGDIGANSLSQDCTSESLLEYQRQWKKKVQSKINSAFKIQSRWIKLSDEEWDKEIEILSEMSIEEFLDFIKAEFTTGKMVKLAMAHPQLAARQLFNIVLKR
jgi:digeranylgeranylglycerophospholipid reductase